MGLRARLAVALVAVAGFAVGIATVLSNLGLPGRVNEAAEERLARQTRDLARVAALFYEEDGRWTREHVLAVERLARTSGLRMTLTGDDTTLASPRGGLPADAATAPVVALGSRVGTLRAAPAAGDLLTPEERHLRHSLDRLHLVAAAISAVAALALAFVLAQGLTGPLRRIRRSAERMAAGDLSARVEPGGGAELTAVGDALNRLAETLGREEELRRASVADLAHELRTPVNALLGRIEAAQDGLLDRRPNLTAMHTEAVRLSRLLDDLGTLADAERPALLLQKEDVELDALLGEALERWRPQFSEREIQLDAQLQRVCVDGEPRRLAQVFDNLLSNALRYTERGGRVGVRTAIVGREAVVEVADTGMGIAPQDIPRVFDRFWRGEKSRSRATGGAGIGLAIVAETVRAHGGRVDVESGLGAGSTFFVTLPVGRVAATASEASRNTTLGYTRS
jgi:two-component system sensor histidine kinase BaeS